MSANTPKFLVQKVPGKGWTVIRRIGSRRAGFTDTPATDNQHLTLDIAQATADAMNRDAARHA